MPSVEELESALAEARAEQTRRSLTEQRNVNTLWAEGTLEDRYAPTTWGSNEYDFRVPSGQLCRLRNVPLERLAQSGILDQLTRLPGLTAGLVEKAQGLPPNDQVMPPAETIKVLERLLLELIPMVVVKPEIAPLPPEGEHRIEGVIYVDSIDFADRVAILNRVVAPLQKLDAFRNQS
jgi:hypothetical protein